MNLKLGFTYIFKDEYWFKKITLPAIYILIPLIGQFVVGGWALSIARNVINGAEEPLQDSVFIDDLKLGLTALVINIVYMFPLYALSSIISLGSSAVMVNIEMSTKTLSIVSIVLAVIFQIIMLFIAILSEIAVLNYLIKDDFKAAFNLKEIWRLFSNNPFDWILIMLIVGLAGMVLAPFGLLACIIGIFFVMTYASAVSGHLTGQAYLRSIQKGLSSENTPE